MSNPVRPALRRVAVSPLIAACAALLVVLAVGAPVLAVEGPTKLLDVTIGPRTGSTTTTISFAVTYRNREGSPADHVSVVIDGAAHRMASDGTTDWKNGVRHRWSTKLPVGTHTIAFEAADTRRFSDTADGGSVTIAAPAPTPTPSPDPTPKPTPSPTPRPDPSPDPTPHPTATPAPSAAPTASPDASPGDGSAAPGGDDSPSGPGSTGDPGSPGGPGDAPGIGGPDGTDTLGGSRTTGGSGGTGTAGPIDGHPGWAGWAPAGEAPAPVVDGDGGPASPGDSTTPPPSSTDAGSAGAAAASTAGGPGWGALAAALSRLGIDDPPGVTVVPMLVGTTGAMTMAFAFAIFGKKRRDEAPPAPDEVLQANAARGHSAVPGGEIARAVAIPAPIDLEAGMPRWRRPSVQAARKADPARSAAVNQPMTFDNGVVTAVDGRERRVIRYAVVRLLDAPDELRSAEIGQLDKGDEVQLVERSGAYWLVLCPNGQQGWIHKMTLGDVVSDAAPSFGRDVDDDVLSAFLAARARA